MTVIPIIVVALGMFPKGLEKSLKELKIKGRIKTTALLKSARIIRKIQETYSERQTVNRPVAQGCGISLYLYKEVRTPSPTSVLYMTLNKLMVRLQ